MSLSSNALDYLMQLVLQDIAQDLLQGTCSQDETQVRQDILRELALMQHNEGRITQAFKELDRQFGEYIILGVRWFTTQNTHFGIVAVQTFDNEWKAYIGPAKGYDADADAQSVAKWGTALSPQEAVGFFPSLNVALYKSY